MSDSKEYYAKIHAENPRVDIDALIENRLVAASLCASGVIPDDLTHRRVAVGRCRISDGPPVGAVRAGCLRGCSGLTARTCAGRHQ
jgi:hypothetical protein